MPSLLSLGPPLNSPNLDLTFKTIAFVGTRLFTFPLVPMKGSRPLLLDRLSPADMRLKSDGEETVDTHDDVNPK